MMCFSLGKCLQGKAASLVNCDVLLLEWALGSDTGMTEGLEGTGQNKLLKADWEPCFCIIWCDKQTFSLAIS